MDFLVEMEIGLPPDYDAKLLADILRRERLRAAEIASSGTFFKRVWIVPCERARIMICSAADARELHETISSLPAMKWIQYQAIPLIPCGKGSSICIPD